MTSHPDPVHALAKRVAVVRVDAKHTVADSIAHLVAHRNDLANFESVVDLALATDDNGPLKGVVHHLGRALSALSYELWAEQIFLGASVLDDVLLHAIQDSSNADPLEAAIRLIHEAGIHQPGFVVYPLHSLAIYGAGLLRGVDLHFFVKSAALLLSPQTNSDKGAVRFLNSAAHRIGVRHRVDPHLVEHWIRSRPIEWLWKNPLIALRVHSFPGGYYENQRLLLSKLEFAASAVHCLATRKDPRVSDVSRHFSSLNANNWETLDIYHYLVFYPKPRTAILGGDCVPFTAQRNRLLELSDFSVDINPKQWRRTSKDLQRVLDAIRIIESGYFQHAIRLHRTDAQARVYRKISSSLRYFRRSFRRNAPDGEGCVALAVAFEALLTDQATGKIRDRIERRIHLLMRRVRGVTVAILTFQRLYDARCRVVHEGQSSDLDLREPQALYVELLVRFVERLKQWQPKTTCNEPMRDIMGDPVP